MFQLFYDGGYFDSILPGLLIRCRNRYVDGGPGATWEAAITVLEHLHPLPGATYQPTCGKKAAALKHTLIPGVEAVNLSIYGHSVCSSMARHSANNLLRPRRDVETVQVSGRLVGVLMTFPLGIL